MALPVQIYNTLSFPLLCREEDEKFTAIENEFRFIAFDCPRVTRDNWEQNPRQVVIYGKTGTKYTGTINPGYNSLLRSNSKVLREPNMYLSDILEKEQGDITIESRFKTINIAEVSDEYMFLGGKEDCRNYITKTLNCMPKDCIVHKTVKRTHKLDSIPDAVFVPSHAIVKY